MKANTILETIGNTPHVRMNRLFGDKEVWMKLERANPGGSIKDRIGLSMIEDGEKRGELKPDSVIIEPTSGNTGIGLAMVAAVKKYKIILVMPESMSIERRRLLAAYGAQLELTPREKGMNGAIERAQELAASMKNTWIPQQFENPANIEIHSKTTAEEIIRDFPEGFDMLVTGVGTGGHITGVGSVLKKKFPRIKVFAVEPTLSPVISGENLDRILSKVSVPDLFQRIFTLKCWMVSFKLQKKKLLSTRCAVPVKKEFSLVFLPVRH